MLKVNLYLQDHLTAKIGHFSLFRVKTGPNFSPFGIGEIYVETSNFSSYRGTHGISIALKTPPWWDGPALELL